MTQFRIAFAVMFFLAFGYLGLLIWACFLPEEPGWLSYLMGGVLIAEISWEISKVIIKKLKKKKEEAEELAREEVNN